MSDECFPKLPDFIDHSPGSSYYDDLKNQPKTGPSEPPRRRGGQAGNRNALKHGFYARNFDPGDTKDLDKHEFDGLQDEIILLRVYIRRVLFKSKPVDDLATSMLVLHRLSTALFCLSRMVRVQKMNAKSGNDEFMEDFSAALADAQKEMGIK